MHESVNTIKIAENIKNSKYKDLKSNDVIHSKVARNVLREELSQTHF